MIPWYQDSIVSTYRKKMTLKN